MATYSLMAHLDLNKNELQNVAIQVLASPPSTPATGQIYFDSTLVKLRVWNGSAWVSYDAAVTLGNIDTTNTTAQATNGAEALTGTIELHKIAKTGTYSDLIGTPTIPAAPGTLNTTATAAQATNANEALSGAVTLHKISKTGSFLDLLNVYPSLSSLDTAMDGGTTGYLKKSAADTFAIVNETYPALVGGKIPAEFLPSFVDDIVNLTHGLVSSAPAASGLTTGISKYYNTTTNKIHIASSTSSWDAGVTPDVSTIYINALGTGNDDTYRYNGTSALVAIGSSLADADTLDGQHASAFVLGNGAITGATNTKITYDAKGLVTGGAAATLDDIGDGATRKLSDYTRKYTAQNGSLTSTGGVCTWTVSHGLGVVSKACTVAIFRESDGQEIMAEVVHTDTNTITIKFNSASTIAAATYRVVVIG